jgi:hypothetical protein
MAKPLVRVEKLRTKDVLLLVPKDATVVAVDMTRTRARALAHELLKATRVHTSRDRKKASAR